jgi:hypothetical protein
VETTGTIIEIDHCIVGALRVAEGCQVVITNSIVNASDDGKVAFAAVDGSAAGTNLRIENSTIIGKVHTAETELVTNALLLARLTADDTWTAPVLADRRQAGCVRFSYLPWDARTARRYRCQPTTAADASRVRPIFTSLQFGEPGYCQLNERCAVEIRQGADDSAEMGAFHDPFQAQRESNLKARLDEYLRFSMEAGLFYES